MKNGNINADRIMAIQNGARQGINRASYMTYLHAGYELREIEEPDALHVIPGDKIISPDDIRAVVYGEAQIVYNETSSAGATEPAE